MEETTNNRVRVGDCCRRFGLGVCCIVAISRYRAANLLLTGLVRASCKI